ncbi:uncharacterized protein [Panulirus ornatus]|uniref:uncharacterized protein n=1 Tax=Panulirus ornatus TaxID=150431 RepID=UPI003A8AA3D0
MGSNQVKTAPSPLLPVVSRAISYQDDQERRLRRGVPRRLGSMVLSNWIQMKRREQALLQKAQIAVEEGRAPPEVLQKVEKYMTKETKTNHIKYHPRLLNRKPNRPRLKAPKLTNTAARRIQESYQRREKEQQEAAKASKRKVKSRVSVRSQVWTTDSAPSDISRRTQIKRGPGPKRAMSLPPSSTLSLQSITTAESSGIGMSRTSSMTSVASSRQKSLYTRQRVRSLSEEGDGFREVPGRHVRRRITRSRSNSVDIRHQGEATRRHKCHESQKNSRQEQQEQDKQQLKHKTRTQQVSQQIPAQQKVNRQQQPRQRAHHEDKDHQNLQQKDDEGQQSHLQPSQQQSPPQQHDEQHPSQLQVKEYQQPEIQVTKEEPSRDQSSQLEENKQQQPPPHHQVNEAKPPQQRQQPRTEKKDQGSQTRLSGPPRPRRLLLTHHIRKRTRSPPDRQEQLSQIQPRTHSSRAGPTQRHHLDQRSDSEQQEEQLVVRETHPSGTFRSEKQDQRQQTATILIETQQEQELKLTSSSQDHRTRPHHSLQSPQQVSEDERQRLYTDLDDLEEGRQQKRVPRMGRRHSNQIEILDNCGEEIRHQETRKMEIVQISRHQIQVHHSQFDGDPQPQQENEPQRLDQQRHQSLEREENPVHQQTPQEDQSQPSEEKAILPKEEPQVAPQVAPQEEEIPNQAETMERKQEVATGQTRWRGLFKQLRESKFAGNSKGLGKGRQKKSLTQSTEGSSDESQGRTQTGTSSTQEHADESQGLRYLGKSVEQSATVESQGGGRPGKFSQHGRRQRTSLDRWRAAAALNRRRNKATPEQETPEATAEGRRSKQSMDRSSNERERQQQPLERVHHEALVERAHYEPPMERGRLVPPVELVQREPSIERVEHLRHEQSTTRFHHDIPMDRFRRDPSLERFQRESSIIRVRRAPLVEYSRHETSTERLPPPPSTVTMERVRHEPMIEHSRTESPTHQGRMVYMERGRNRLSPERGQMRTYYTRSHSTEPSERRYTAETLEPGYIRSYQERRYIGGSADQTGAVSESGYTTRPLEPSYMRTYSDNSYSGGRLAEPDFSRAYSEHSYTERSVDNDYNRVYSDRILDGNRWKNDEEWGARDRGRYRRAVVAPASAVASSPPMNHRAL